jgi:hypothetical protein
MILPLGNYVFIHGILECLKCYHDSMPVEVYQIGSPHSLSAAIARAESHEEDHH